MRKFIRSKEWWLRKAREEPDCFISAGIPGPPASCDTHPKGGLAVAEHDAAWNTRHG